MQLFIKTIVFFQQNIDIDDVIFFYEKKHSIFLHLMV